jgi:hypothetical protein
MGYLLNGKSKKGEGADDPDQPVRSRVLRKLLGMAEADVFAFEAIFCGACVSAADHRLLFAKLAPGNQSHGSAPRTGHDSDVWILRMTELGLVFKKENRAGVHFLGDPFFKELQVGIHAALLE